MRVSRKHYHPSGACAIDEPMLVLSETDVKKLIDIPELIESLEAAHIRLSTGKAVMPVRLVVPLPQIHGRITSMPAYLGEANALGMKVVTYFEQNPKRGLPAILATIMLYDTETGKIGAIMDGSTITAIRTACASAMATKALANTETAVVGILGAGVQARAHILALCQVRKITTIKIYSPSGNSARKLKEEIEPQVNVKIEPVESAEKAARDVDLLVTVTTAKEPILEARWLKPGVHINAVGSHRPDLREIDGETLKRAKIFVDSREAIMVECGDVLLAIKEGAIAADHIAGEIGEVLAGTKPGRSTPNEITLYKSVGVAIQDVATAQLVYRKALEQSAGHEVPI
ncbi:MAG: ornithine cyclodeaminase family protein [Candidatus Binatia bacterium]